MALGGGVVSYLEMSLGILGCGYLALTITGVATTLWIVDFISNAVGRNLTEENPPHWSYSILGLFYTLVYMWAVGLVATWGGGRTKLALKRAKQTIDEGGLSADEVRRLEAACKELEVTSQFKG
jgi:hypothetical protein